MSPLDMLIFLFFILVTVKAASSCIDYWKGEEDIAVPSAGHTGRTGAERASLSRTVRTGRPSSVRITPIKRADIPVTALSRSHSIHEQSPFKDMGAA